MQKKHSVFITLVLIACFFLTVLPVSAAGTPPSQSENGALPRGSRFTISITGLPNIPYYIWVTRTSTLSGEPGEQPPVIVGSQWHIQKDPPDGPYTIGSYQFNNGNGRTIRDDIPPSTPPMSNTNYYALVTTDTDGRAVVAFQTSINTAMRTFSIKVENPQSAAGDNILVERGDLKVAQGAVSIEAETPTAAPETIPPAPTLAQSLPPATTTPTPTPMPTETPTQRAPPEIGFGLLAVGTGFLKLRKR